MKTKRIVIVLSLLIVLCLAPSGIALYLNHRPSAEKAEVHTHQWGQWEQPQKDGEGAWHQFRSCTNCGLSEMRVVKMSK